mmetsp:Transcript_47673/g.102057  ORF Transcript_47673/g.102057 Transcript_47673/m.102057 type:complete len:146 (-) Transcript_47673:61-498(-)
MEAQACREQVLEVLGRDLQEEIKRRMHECAERACEEVDLLVNSALRQLPPNLRAMDAKEAFVLGVPNEVENLEEKKKELQGLSLGLQSLDGIQKGIGNLTKDLEELTAEERRSAIAHMQLICQLKLQGAEASSQRPASQAQSGGA